MDKAILLAVAASLAEAGRPPAQGAEPPGRPAAQLGAARAHPEGGPR